MQVWNQWSTDVELSPPPRCRQAEATILPRCCCGCTQPPAPGPPELHHCCPNKGNCDDGFLPVSTFCTGLTLSLRRAVNQNSRFKAIRVKCGQRGASVLLKWQRTCSTLRYQQWTEQGPGAFIWGCGILCVIYRIHGIGRIRLSVTHTHFNLFFCIVSIFRIVLVSFSCVFSL